MGGFATPMPATFEDFAFHGRNGSLTSTGDLVLETRAWREKIFATRTPERRPSAFGRVSAIVNQAFPGAMMGGQGQLALNQLLVVMDGIDNPPFTKKFFTEPDQHVPRRDVHRSAPRPRPVSPHAAAAPAHRADLLHRGHERAARSARPGPDTARPDGPLRVAAHADQEGPARHLRPLPQQGLARPRARLREAAGRDRAHHERVLAGDDRAGLLDGADLRPPRGEAALRLGGDRRGDDDDRVGHGDQHRVHPGGDTGDRHPRGGPRGRRPRLHEGRGVDPPVDPPARRGPRPPPGPREGGAVQLLAQRGARAPDLDARRDGGRASLLRRELDRRRRRRPERHGALGLDGRRLRDGSRADRVRGRVQASEGQDRGRGARGDRQEVPANRRSDHESIGRWECTATHWAVSWAIRRSGRWPRSSSGRRTSPRTS